MKYTAKISEDFSKPLEPFTKVTELVDEPSLDVKIFTKKTHPNAQPLRVAYDGTSAAFDVAACEDIIVPAQGSAVATFGWVLTIPETDRYYMTSHLRSSINFKTPLKQAVGIIDAGYTGEISYRLHNTSDEDFIIKAGEYFGQILVHEKPRFEFVELSDAEFAEFEANQQRGKGGFGSSNSTGA